MSWAESVSWANWTHIRWVCSCCCRCAFTWALEPSSSWLALYRYSESGQWWSTTGTGRTSWNGSWWRSASSVDSSFCPPSDYLAVSSTSTTTWTSGWCSGIGTFATSSRYPVQCPGQGVRRILSRSLKCTWSSTCALCWSAWRAVCGCGVGRRWSAGVSSSRGYREKIWWDNRGRQRMFSAEVVTRCRLRKVWLMRQRWECRCVSVFYGKRKKKGNRRSRTKTHWIVVMWTNVANGFDGAQLEWNGHQEGAKDQKKLFFKHIDRQIIGIFLIVHRRYSVHIGLEIST